MEPCPIRWSSAARSHAGCVREVNEDACLEQPGRSLWAVADGMGGHSLGEFASRLAIRSLVDMPPPPSLAGYVAAARERLEDANRRLREEAARRDVPLIGTTIAALVAWQRRCACLWAGDSRIYLHRDGRLRQLTRDHSEAEEARARRAGGSTDDTLVLPPSNVITRALGGDDRIEIDCEMVDVQDGDIFLLCSDGLSNEVADHEIEQALRPGHCPQAAQALVELALAHGGRDNVTVVVVRAQDLFSADRTAVHPAL